MYAKTYLVAVGLAGLHPVAADFKMFLGASNDFAAGSPGGGFSASTDQAYFFNHPPSCKDGAGILTVNGNNDVSKTGGYACDGCTGDPKTIAPDRFEINDKGAQIFANAGPNPHFTIYKDENKKGSYNMVDLDNKPIGTCTLSKERKDWTCAHAVIGADSARELFDCKTKYTIKGSN